MGLTSSFLGLEDCTHNRMGRVCCPDAFVAEGCTHAGMGGVGGRNVCCPVVRYMHLPCCFDVHVLPWACCYGGNSSCPATRISPLAHPHHVHPHAGIGALHDPPGRIVNKLLADPLARQVRLQQTMQLCIVGHSWFGFSCCLCGL